MNTIGMDNKVIVPPLKLQGIKTKLIPYIHEKVTWDENGKWIEPFLGSGVVALNINPRRALLSDTNIHIIQFYQSIQAQKTTGKIVREYLEHEGDNLFRKGEIHYYDIRERFNKNHHPLDFLFINRACFNGMMRFNRSGHFNTPFCRKIKRFSKSYITKIVNQVVKVETIVSNNDWNFVCKDWKDILPGASSCDFVYIDPPYIGRHVDYFNSWTLEDATHLENTIKTLPCQFIYSMWAENKYRKNNSTLSSFSQYNISFIDHYYHLGATENLRNKMTEALITR